MKSIEAQMTFAVETGDKPAAVSVGPAGQIEHTGQYETHRVEIRDGRAQAGFSIDAEGFELRRHDTAVVDFHDREAIAVVYYPEIEALISEVTGAPRVVVFDHTVRTSDESEQAALKIREPLGVAHNDYTHWSGPNRLRLALPDEADALSSRRFAIVQVWRATHDPIERDPLAVCDARSVDGRHLLAAERRHKDRVGEIYQLLHHPEQKWFYFPRMRRDEALVFKVYDSMTDGRARFTPHGSFDDPTTVDEAPPRRSIEARALALFGRNV